jgi:hypothetical protein
MPPITERRLALAVDPRVIVVGDPHRPEPGLLGPLGDGHQRSCVVLLTGQGVCELNQGLGLPADRVE